jgi:hypothetical protein
MTSNYDLSVRLMPVGHRLNWSARIVGTGACMHACVPIRLYMVIARNMETLIPSMGTNVTGGHQVPIPSQT